MSHYILFFLLLLLFSLLNDALGAFGGEGPPQLDVFLLSLQLLQVLLQPVHVLLDVHRGGTALS